MVGWERGDTPPWPWDAAAFPVTALPSAPATTGPLAKELEAENHSVKPTCASQSPSEKKKKKKEKIKKDGAGTPPRCPWLSPRLDSANSSFGKKSSILGKSPMFPSAQQIVPVSAEPTKAKMFITKENYMRGVPESRTKCKTGETNVKSSIKVLMDPFRCGVAF